MNSRTIIFAVASACMLTPAIAMADCHEGAARSAEAIAKDGATAPMQTPDGMAKQQPDGGMTTTMDSPGTSNTGQGIVQDGSTMPMATEPGEADTAVATSPADVAAQQEGEKTAAAQGREGCSQ